MQAPESAGAADGSPDRGVGPFAIAHLIRDRSTRLAATLAVAVAIPVALLFRFQFRSISDLSQSSRVVLHELSQDSADGLTRSIEDTLKAARIEILRVTQGRTEPLDLPFIQRTYDAALAKMPFITRFYVRSGVGPVHRDEVLAYDRSTRDFQVNPPESAQILSRLYELAPSKRAIVTFDSTIDGRRMYVLAQLRFQPLNSRQRLSSFQAFTVDAGRLRTEFLPGLLQSRLKSIEGPAGFPPLVVTLFDDTNRVVFPTNAPAPGHFEEERRFPLIFFEKDLLEYAAPYEAHREVWRLQTGYGEHTIEQIITDRERPQRLMMAMLAAVMALGVLFVVRAAAREVRLAELKANFVASVSHDLKTPLALIQLFAETLELGRLKTTDRAQEYYRIINSEARKLSRLINNLLDFSRIEAGLRRYKVEPTDLGSVVRRVLDSLQSQFRHYQFTVTSTEAVRVPPVLIDPEAAQQAIENLLSNAMKYSPEHRHILVEVDAAGDFGRVSVTDRGIGIAPRYQRRIFRKFYRIQTDAGSGAQGTGLGLAIVDHIMRSLGGFVRVQSEPGRGSTFTLYFPIDKEAHGDEADTGDRGRAADVARTA
jgi:signal transduction histidine kinase